MVVFHCGNCGEALKKNQVDKHILSTCRRVQRLSCIDCGKDFDQNSYKEHIKCMSEQEKYGGANYNAPANMNKGEKKQNQWFEIVQSAINLNQGTVQAKAMLKKLQYYPNTPRKRAKFLNFVNNSIRGFPPRITEEVWSILENLIPKGNGNNENQQSGKTETEHNDSEITVQNPIKSNGATKRPITDDVDETVKRSKTDANNDHPQDHNNEVLSLNSRFEWYEEIKRVLSKADDQTLPIETLNKKIIKRYKKIKPDQADDFEPVLKKLEKKLQRAPFVQEIEQNVYKLTD